MGDTRRSEEERDKTKERGRASRGRVNVKDEKRGRS